MVCAVSINQGGEWKGVAAVRPKTVHRGKRKMLINVSRRHVGTLGMKIILEGILGSQRAKRLLVTQ